MKGLNKVSVLGIIAIMLPGTVFSQFSNGSDGSRFFEPGYSDYREMSRQPGHFRSEILFKTVAVNSNAYVVNDFQVNENSGHATQDYPALASNGNGTIVAVWRDYRNGIIDIYGQIFQENAAVGGNFQVNKEEAGNSPDVAVNADGDFMVVWNNQARLFHSDGTPKTDPVTIAEVAGGDRWHECEVAADPDGDFVVVANAVMNRDYLILASRINSLGEVIDPPIVVNDTSRTKYAFEPRIVCNPQGYFMVTWRDRRYDTDYIFAQRISTTFEKIGENIAVGSASRAMTQNNPVIAVDSNGNSIIAWHESSYPASLYAQRFLPDGLPDGENFLLDNGYSPSVIGSQNGSFIYTRVLRDQSLNDEIILGTLESSDTVSTGNVTITEPGAACNFSIPAPIGIGSNGYTLVVWSDLRDDDPNIYGQWLDREKNKVGDNFRLNDDSQPNGTQEGPQLAIDKQGNFAITWMVDPHIYVRKYGADGQALTEFLIANDNQEPDRLHRDSYIAMDAAGNFTVVWEDGTSWPRELYAQRFAADGTRLGSNFKINEIVEYTDEPVIAMNDSGYAVVTWGQSSFLMQILDPNGNLLGQNIEVVDENMVISCPLSPAIDENANSVIAWSDKRSGKYDVYFQRYSKGGQKIGENTRISQDDLADYRSYPAVIIEPDGGFSIAWDEYRDDKISIWARRYDAEGEPSGDCFKVTDICDGNIWINFKFATDEAGRKTIVWCLDDNIYGLRFDADWTVASTPFCIHADKEYHQSYPSVKMRDGKIYTCWTDNRYGEVGINIWANVIQWDQITEIQTTGVRSCDSFQLYPNYPNPFNATTQISYNLPNDAYVCLTIYDIRGSEIVALVNEHQNAGSHRLTWSGLDNIYQAVPTGVYLLQMQSGGQIFRQKMVLLK